MIRRAEQAILRERAAGNDVLAVLLPLELCRSVTEIVGVPVFPDGNVGKGRIVVAKRR